ncbi:MAG: hypothetical protein V1914_01365 [archaeon]
MVTISKLLEKKLRLYIKKISLIGKVFADKPHYLLRYKDLNALLIIVSREVVLNKKLLREIKLHAEARRGHLEPFVINFENTTRELIFVLKQEKKVLNKIDIYNLILHEASIIFFNRSKTKYFDYQFSRFQQLHKREQELDAKLFLIASQEKRSLAIAKIKVYRGIAKDINIRAKTLLSVVGNNTLVRKNAQELLKLLNKLQNTEIYTYIHSDLNFIKNQVREVIKNPNKSKVKTLLAGIYILAPGTFETTAYILLVKNLMKITVRKINHKPRKFNHVKDS